jgi:hypothetical protein
MRARRAADFLRGDVDRGARDAELQSRQFLRWSCIAFEQ